MSESNYKYLLKRYGLDDKESAELTPEQEAQRTAVMNGNWQPTQEELDSMDLDQWVRYERLNGREPSASDMIKRGLQKGRKESNDPGVSAADLGDASGKEVISEVFKRDARPVQPSPPHLSEAQKLIREGLDKNAPSQQTGEPG